MKVLIAPDSYKNNMKSEEVIDLIKEGLRLSLPQAELIGLPMADGGEGTTETLIAATNGSRHEVLVSGPLGEPVTAFFGISGDGKKAFMEMASASGIELVPSDKLNPMKASTRGTGELIKAILDLGIPEIIIGIGGSATVDGGIGMAQALGFLLGDANGEALPPGAKSLKELSFISSKNIHPNINKTRFRVACDVTNPLLGPQGSAAIYGPQKGATPEMVPLLEEGLNNLSKNWIKNGFLRTTDSPGDGAAGGLGAGLRAFLKAEITSGAELVAEISGFNSLLPQVNVLITGEGMTDGQTASGKLCSVLAAKATSLNIPVILLSGALGGDPALLNKTFTAAFSISSGHNSLKDSIKNSKRDLRHTAENLGNLINININMKG